MLEFFRKYQRYFFLVTTVVVIASFTLFGTYDTFAKGEEKEDRIIGRTISGSAMMLSEVQKLSRFIATDREDSMEGRGLSPNFCNDGVIRYDFLKDRLADLLVKEYFDVLKEDFSSRLDKAKRFRSYAHPDAPFLSAKTIWEHLIPGLNQEIAAVQSESEPTLAFFNHLSRLYQLQGRLSPETLRRILIYQHQQYPTLRVDQKLVQDDLSVFGFHTASDWFGHDFIDLVAEFILNSAAAASEKGYTVSLEEAKGDLIHRFQETMQKLAAAKIKPDVSFHQHLRSLGFDERSAAEVWQKVLLFRRYFHDVGGAAFVDSLPYKDFASYAKETAVVQKYQWQMRIQSAQDLAELNLYIRSIAPKSEKGLPTAFLSVSEVEKKFPALVQTTYLANVAEVSKKQVGLTATVKQLLQWQTDDKNWAQLVRQFSLPSVPTKDERFAILATIDPILRAKIDELTRERLVDQNPSWVEEALASAPRVEKIWSISGNEEPTLQKEGTFYSIEDLKIVEDKHILRFEDAREILAERIGKVDEAFTVENNPFSSVAKAAYDALQKNPMDSNWVQSGNNPIQDQFKLIRNEQSISRTSKENWMKEQAFMMLPDFWSPIHVADDGEISFFYLQEKKVTHEPILESLNFGKETLAADAKAYVTERLLQTVKMKNAIVIPVQRGDE
ncbi:MAG: hypothetical protein COT85_05215 [Chlamydiae bacterium CG10_big_fil_rev_8_21_14_0_10_42_34]|nr:MAG: hypothetical protein COT85_05215 [Chlamydiae bacterium CG10_big_fil_rev_8_21_14_0_10_42_34]